MESERVFTLLIITLLPLCRATIPDISESWYSANVINDGSFSPKPLTEIFSTEPPSFSSTNPIIVLSTTTENLDSVKTSTSSPISTSKVPTTTSSTTSTTIGTSTDRADVIPLQTTTSTPASQPTTIQTLQPSMQTERQMTTTTLPPQSPPQSQSIIFQPQLPPFQSSQPIIIQAQPNSSQPQPRFLQQFVLPAHLAVPQAVPVAPQQTLQDIRPTGQQNPNYFVIYQQAPQSIQSFPPGSRQPAATINSQPIPTLPPTTIMRATQAPRVITKATPITTASQTPKSQLPTVRPSLIPQYPVLRIRMITPTGSITNVNVNPPAAPISTTTTSKPTSTRSRKTRRKNNYDDCVNSCGGTRQPICSSPIGVTPINPDTLKGFPSICHMACHNSFRRNAYEKVVDGKCGRLRTRIRTVDSDTKLKRDELNKALYTIVQPGQTVVEFSPLTS